MDEYNDINTVLIYWNIIQKRRQMNYQNLIVSTNNKSITQNDSLRGYVLYDFSNNQNKRDRIEVHEVILFRKVKE